MSITVYLVEFAARAWPRFFVSGTPNANGSRYLAAARVPIVGGITYKVTGQARRDATANGTLTLGAVFYDAAGVVTGFVLAANAVTPGTSWATYSATFGATGTAIPGGSVAMAPLFFANNGGTLGVHHIKGCAIENNAVPGVALSHGADMRDLAPWVLFAGTAATVLTEIDATPVTLNLRYSTAPYVSAAADTPASTPYEARVLQPGLVRSELPADWRGLISGSFGELVLANADGALADWTYLGLEGQPITLLYGRADAARSTFAPVMVATIQQAVVGRESVQLRLMGPEAALQLPLLTKEPPSSTRMRGLRYLGTNALPSGLEGTADDLLGNYRPRLYGRVKNIAPPCINTARNIYEVHNPYTAGLYGGAAPEAIAVLAVRDRGLVLTAGADYTDLADLEANAPSAGAYRVWPAGGLLRTGSTPSGQLTCDAEMWPVYFDGARTGWQDLAATVMWEVFEGLWLPSLDHDVFDPPDNWTGAGVTSSRGADVGVWVNDQRTVAEVLDAICGSAGAWYGYVEWDNVLSGGELRLGWDVFPPPLSLWEPASFTGHDLSYVPAFDANNLLKMRALPDSGAGRGAAVVTVDLGYAPNANPMVLDVASGVSAADRAELAAPLQRVTVTSGDVLMNPRGRTLVRDTALTVQASAEDEALRLLHLMKYPKVWLEIEVALQAVLDMAVKPRLGGYVKVTPPNISILVADGSLQAWGYFTVHALELDFNTSRVRMLVRQATEQTRV